MTWVLICDSFGSIVINQLVHFVMDDPEAGGVNVEDAEAAGFWNLPSDSPALVLESVPCKLSDVAYRHSTTGELYWDVMYVADTLKEKSTCVLKRLQEICSRSFESTGLSGTALHKRGKVCRPGGWWFIVFNHLRGFIALTTLLVRWGMLNCNCAVSLLLLWFFADMMERCQNSGKRQIAADCLTSLAHEAVLQSYRMDNRQVLLDNQGHYVTLGSSGAVSGFAEALGGALHSSIVKSWQLQWNAMVEQNELSATWEADQLEFPLADVITFVFSVRKFRKTSGKHKWQGASASYLQCVQKHLLLFLQEVLGRRISQFVQSSDPYNVPVPSRTIRLLVTVNYRVAL